jgi:hypothetical protein
MELQFLSLDRQILNAQILIQTMCVFKDRPIISTTLHLCNPKEPTLGITLHSTLCSSVSKVLP